MGSCRWEVGQLVIGMKKQFCQRSVAMKASLKALITSLRGDNEVASILTIHKNSDEA